MAILLLVKSRFRSRYPGNPRSPECRMPRRTDDHRSFQFHRSLRKSPCIATARIGLRHCEPVAANMPVVQPPAGISGNPPVTERKAGMSSSLTRSITGFRLTYWRIPDSPRHRTRLTCLGKIIGGDFRRRLRGKPNDHGASGPQWTRLPGGHPLRNPGHVGRLARWKFCAAKG